MLSARGNQPVRPFRMVLCFFALLAFISVFIFLMIGSFSEETLSGTPVASGDCRVLLLEEQGGAVWAVCSGQESSFLLRVNGATGQVEQRQEIPLVLAWAAMRGEKLFARADLPSGSLFLSWDRDTLEQAGNQELPWGAEDLARFGCGPSGEILCVLSRTGNILRELSPTGEEREFPFSENIEFFGSDGQGRVFLRAGKTLWLRDLGGGFREISCLAPAACCLGDGLFLDGDEMVCLLEDNSLIPLFQCPVPIYDEFSFSLDRENCLILSAAGGNIYRYSQTGELLGSCQLERRALAVCGAGAVCRQGESLCYIPFSFSQSTTPAPSPLSPSSSQP